ncbi:MAG: hypothetical protein RLQ25_08230 [Alphaproteobacteria bacterium]
MTFQGSISEATQKAQRDAEQDNADRAREILIDILTKVFDRAAAYTSLILFGGYAGGFAIWNFTNDLLGPTAKAWVALLLTISLATFIFFEVFKMMYSSKGLFQQRAILTKSLPPTKFIEEIQMLERQENRKIVKYLIPIWIAALAVAVSTALGAVGICLLVFGASVAGSL